MLNPTNQYILFFYLPSENSSYVMVSKKQDYPEQDNLEQDYLEVAGS